MNSAAEKNVNIFDENDLQHLYSLFANVVMKSTKVINKIQVKTAKNIVFLLIYFQDYSNIELNELNWFAIIRIKRPKCFMQ